MTTTALDGIREEDIFGGTSAVVLDRSANAALLAHVTAYAAKAAVYAADVAAAIAAAEED